MAKKNAQESVLLQFIRLPSTHSIPPRNMMFAAVLYQFVDDITFYLQDFFYLPPTICNLTSPYSAALSRDIKDPLMCMCENITGCVVCLRRRHRRWRDLVVDLACLAD